MRRLLVVAVLAGCISDSPAPRRESPLVESIRAARRRMHARFDSALDLETAIAVADLDRARADGAFIYGLAEPDFVDEWRPSLEAVRTAAHGVSLATSLDSAADRVVGLGLACAHCHEAMSATIRFPWRSPPYSASFSGDMRRHQWAGLEMWEGVIGPNDGLWLEGAGELAALPSTMLEREDAAHLRDEARRALDARANDERAAVFGRILATCASCHSKLRVR